MAARDPLAESLSYYWLDFGRLNEIYRYRVKK